MGLKSYSGGDLLDVSCRLDVGFPVVTVDAYSNQGVCSMWLP